MLNYETSGVDIDQGNDLVSFIKTEIKNKDVDIISQIGGYNALVELNSEIKNPVMVFSCDGVGTKLKLANTLEEFQNIGIDLVAMVANDIICSGAIPKVFLDYIAHSDLTIDQLKSIIIGIQQGCELAGMSLVGGETAQLPGLYASKKYDLAGFGMGLIEKENIIHPGLVKPGDTILGLTSSGIHSNGYSLINQILNDKNIDLESRNNLELKERILLPTTIYCHGIIETLKHFKENIHGIAHITGGGFYENVPRILPDNVFAEFNTLLKNNLKEGTLDSLFQWIMRKSSMTEAQMLRTFNCGFGMIMITDRPKTIEEFWTRNFYKIANCYTIGEIKFLPKNNKVVIKGVDL